MIAPVETYGEAFYSIRRHENVNTCRFLPMAAPFADPGFDPSPTIRRAPISDTPPRSRGAFRVRAVASVALEKREGAGKAGCWPHPWPACKQKAGGVTTGSAKHPA